jgi:prepilin-type N-terminal cleavage/methylation domain-containing protein
MARPILVRRRAEAGFSLVELVVALAVLAVGLGLAAGIVIESQRMAAQAGLELRQPAAEEALDLLRVELQGAAGAGGGPGLGGVAYGWSRDRLVLVRPDGLTLTYERDGDRLVRRVGLEGVGRTAVPGLVSWRWAREGPNLVRVEVVYEARRGPGGVFVSPRGRIAGTHEWRERRLTAALRGGGSRRGW